MLSNLSMAIGWTPHRFKVEFDFVDGPQREAVSGSDAVVDHARNTAAKRPAPARVEAQSAPASITCPKCGQGAYGANIRTNRMILLSNNITDSLFLQ